MTPWLVHELRNLGLEVVCLDARHARGTLKMQINKTDQNDAEGLAQIVRTGWYRSVHVKSFESHRARALLGARTQLTGMTTRLSNHIRGVLKTFGLLPGAMRGLPCARGHEDSYATCARSLNRERVFSDAIGLGRAQRPAPVWNRPAGVWVCHVPPYANSLATIAAVIARLKPSAEGRRAPTKDVNLNKANPRIAANQW